ncbi:MFS transporter [Orrella sp. 11846]|uniref:MFS transporter n=1 Tax=Orrella sp. 11846 TaxID=3409913 RepID=UPI003B5AD0E6
MGVLNYCDTLKILAPSTHSSRDQVRTASDAATQSASDTPVSQGLDVPQRHWAALCQLLAIAMSVLDASMINVGLPIIAQDLNISASLVVWVVNAFGLTVVALLLPLSSVVERFGLGRLFTTGLTLFMVGAAVSAASINLPMLLLGRIVQGMGAASIFCLSATFVRSIYPPHLLSRGIGLVAMTVSVSAVVGPTLGSIILTLGSWRWLFAIMLPISAFLWVIKRHLPVTMRIQRSFDVVSALLCAFGIGFLILGLNFLVEHTGLALIAIAGAAGLLILLTRRSVQRTAPLFPVDLLQIRPLRFAIAASHLSFSSQMAAFVALPFYLLNGLGRDQLMVGVLMAGWPAGAAVMSVVAGRLADRFPIPILCAIGAGCVSLSMAMISGMNTNVGDGWVFVCMVLGGLGFGFFQTPNNRILLGSGPPERLGALGGLQAVTRVFGQTTGAALVASAFALSQSNGPVYGLWVSMTFSSLAVALNIYRQIGLKAHEQA